MKISMHDAIQSHLRDFKNQLYTCTPAIVDSYDPNTCSVNVYPAIFHPDTEGFYLREAFLEKVPLHFPATQELGITYPIKKGDTVLLVFGHIDSEEWLFSEEDYTYPKTNRQHNVNDAYAIAGVFKYGRSPVQSDTENDLNIYYKNSHIIIKENQDIELSSPTQVTINTPETIVTGNITVQGATSLSSNVTSSGKDISNTHTHGGVTVGASSTGVPD